MVLDLFKLEGKTAWITGGSKGLGEVMANALAEVGANVVITSRSDQESKAKAEEITRKHGRRGFGMAAEVTDTKAIAAVVERARKELGGIDILIANAGINVRKSTLDISVAEWQNVLDINLTGPFLCSKAVAPGMIEKGWGRIIYMSSMLGLVGMAARPAYTSTKGALVLLAKNQALEYAKNGITVNALAPGPFATPMNTDLLKDPEKYAAFVAKIPIGRWAELHELAGAAVFLASNASSFVTGTTLAVDGGWTAQ